MDHESILTHIKDLDRALSLMKVETAANTLLVGCLYKHVATKLNEDAQEILVSDILRVREKAFKYLLGEVTEPVYFETWRDLLDSCLSHLRRT